MYGTGISQEGEVLDLANKLDIVVRGGSWFNYGDIRLGQGRDNAKEYLKANPELMAEIEAKVRENADKLLKSPRAARRQKAGEGRGRPCGSARRAGRSRQHRRGDG